MGCEDNKIVLGLLARTKYHHPPAHLTI